MRLTGLQPVATLSFMFNSYLSVTCRVVLPTAGYMVVLMASAALLATLWSCAGPDGTIAPQFAGAGRTVAQGASVSMGDIGAGAMVSVPAPAAAPARNSLATIAAAGVAVAAIGAFGWHLYASHKRSIKTVPV